MKNLKCTLYVLSLCASITFAGTVIINPEQLKFTYESFDGESYLKCTHLLEDADAHDWLVTCKYPMAKRRGRTFERKYRVHLLINRYTKFVSPKMSYEILYWVTDRTATPLTGHSTTNWLHFAEPSQLVGTSLSVGVDNDMAGLYLDINM